MIVIDTSALIAILANEPEADIFLKFILDAEEAIIGAPTVFEYLMVVEGERFQSMRRSARDLLKLPAIREIAWEPSLAELAHEAFRAFGKGRHPARLNFGDCMSYALAKSLNAPLLFKGHDFAKTDIRSAI